ncbi:MAG: DNA polymerase, partial [Patescibacteria group bacterium]
VDALPELVNPKTKRIHTSYNQTIAATGRLSSVDPNLQNIPIRTELGQQIRRAFIAPPGKVLLSLDYSQIELRIIAHLAQDETFIKAFKHGADIHTETAAEIHGVDVSAVTPEMRRAAKSINFGILYGMGVYGLSRDAKISNDEAKYYLERYFKLHPAIEKYIVNTKALARTQGYVETLFGRKRFLPDINSGMHQVKAAAERAAINMPAQGTAADIIKKAMLAVADLLQQEKLSAVMLLQVHDELVFEVDKATVQKEADLIKHVMETVVTLKVPLIVDIGIGQNWQDLS